MKEQLHKTTASQLSGKAVYLFGAGKIGRATLEYLRDIVELRGILDNNKKEMIVAGKVYPVSHPSAVLPPAADYAPRQISEALPSTVRASATQPSTTQAFTEGSSAVQPANDAIVIVAVLDYEPAVKQLKALGWQSSRIFISVSWKIPFEDDPEKLGYEDISFSETEARALLADPYSKMLYDFILENRGGSVNLYPYSQLSPIRNRHGYWEDVPVPRGLDCAIMDCGAYEGDSIDQILEAISPKKCTYYAFEPDDHVRPTLEKAEERLLEKARRAKGPQGSFRFVNISKGVWLKDAALTFHYHSEDAASTLSDNQNLKASDGSSEGAFKGQRFGTAAASGQSPEPPIDDRVAGVSHKEKEGPSDSKTEEAEASSSQSVGASDGSQAEPAGRQEPETANGNVNDKKTVPNEAATVSVTSIDSIQAREQHLFIKMDIEGSEAAAIRGAEKTIREKRPFLAVCAYHRPSDLFMLPALMKSINPNYRIFLRGGLHYTYYAIDGAY